MNLQLVGEKHNCTHAVFKLVKWHERKQFMQHNENININALKSGELKSVHNITWASSEEPLS